MEIPIATYSGRIPDTLHSVSSLVLRKRLNHTSPERRVHARTAPRPHAQRVAAARARGGAGTAALIPHKNNSAGNPVMVWSVEVGAEDIPIAGHVIDGRDIDVLRVTVWGMGESALGEEPAAA